jgi:sugar lactone lactonase YvrE
MVFDEPETALILAKTCSRLCSVRVILWEPLTDIRRGHGFRLPGSPKVRFNDARADPRGSLWVGSMRNNLNADGSAARPAARMGPCIGWTPMVE